MEESAELAREVPQWGELVESMKAHLAAHSVDIAGPEIRLSPMLEFNAEKGVFVGNRAAAANDLLKREYRAPYVVPEISDVA